MLNDPRPKNLFNFGGRDYVLKDLDRAAFEIILNSMETQESMS